jgi:chromosome segregation ATPase
MREVDMSYNKISSLLDEAERELEQAEQSISDAESEVDNAKEIIKGIKNKIEIRQKQYDGKAQRNSLAIESVKHLRREAERIEENLLKDS